MMALRAFVYSLWGILGLAIIGGVIALQFLRYEKPPAYEDWNRRSTKQNLERRDREQREYEAAEAARKAAQEAHVARVTGLIADVEKKWRADIQAAQAGANAGVVPPMLDVQESAHAVIVTNKLSDQPVCVSLQRVARRSARANDFDRCRLDVETCRELLPKASFRFQLFTTGNPAACMTAPLEFRVGTPFSPEPSWWSSSALEDFDQRPAPLPLDLRSSQNWPLRGSIEQLGELLVERDRAARWRSELRAPAGQLNVERK